MEVREVQEVQEVLGSVEASGANKYLHEGGAKRRRLEHMHVAESRQ